MQHTVVRGVDNGLQTDGEMNEATPSSVGFAWMRFAVLIRQQLRVGAKCDEGHRRKLIVASY